MLLSTMFGEKVCDNDYVEPCKKRFRPPVLLSVKVLNNISKTLSSLLQDLRKVRSLPRLLPPHHLAYHRKRNEASQ